MEAVGLWGVGIRRRSTTSNSTGARQHFRSFWEMQESLLVGIEWGIAGGGRRRGGIRTEWAGPLSTPAKPNNISLTRKTTPIISQVALTYHPGQKSTMALVLGRLAFLTYQ